MLVKRDSRFTASEYSYSTRNIDHGDAGNEGGLKIK